MRKLFRTLVAAYKAGYSRAVARRNQAPLDVIMARLMAIDPNFTPPCNRMKLLNHRILEIARQGNECHQDIAAAFARGDDFKNHIAELRLVFGRYEEVFEELSIEHAALKNASRIYNQKLEQMVRTL